MFHRGYLASSGGWWQSSRPLSDFWDIRTPLGIALGFDLLKFDREIAKSPANKSIAQVVKEKFGQRGLEILDKLIGE